MDMDDNGYVIAIWKLRFSIGVSAPLFGQGIRCSNWGWFVRLGKLGGWFILGFTAVIKLTNNFRTSFIPQLPG